MADKYRSPGLSAISFVAIIKNLNFMKIMVANSLNMVYKYNMDKAINNKDGNKKSLKKMKIVLANSLNMVYNYNMMKITNIKWAQDKFNALHVYCRLRKYFGKATARKISRIYEIVVHPVLYVII